MDQHCTAWLYVLEKQHRWGAVQKQLQFLDYTIFLYIKSFLFKANSAGGTRSGNSTIATPKI